MYIFRINNLQLYTSIQTRVKSMSAKYTWNTQPVIYSKKHTSFLLFTSFRPACCKKWGIVSSVLTGHTAVGIQCLLEGSHGNKMVQESLEVQPPFSIIGLGSEPRLLKRDLSSSERNHHLCIFEMVVDFQGNANSRKITTGSLTTSHFQAIYGHEMKV